MWKGRESHSLAPDGSVLGLSVPVLMSMNLIYEPNSMLSCSFTLERVNWPMWSIIWIETKINKQKII